jgi:hypothetical protein
VISEETLAEVVPLAVQAAVPVETLASSATILKLQTIVSRIVKTIQTSLERAAKEAQQRAILRVE